MSTAEISEVDRLEKLVGYYKAYGIARGDDAMEGFIAARCEVLRLTLEANQAALVEIKKIKSASSQITHTIY